MRRPRSSFPHDFQHNFDPLFEQSSLFSRNIEFWTLGLFSQYCGFIHHIRGDSIPCNMYRRIHSIRHCRLLLPTSISIDFGSAVGTSWACSFGKNVWLCICFHFAIFRIGSCARYFQASENIIWTGMKKMDFHYFDSCFYHLYSVVGGSIVFLAVTLISLRKWFMTLPEQHGMAKFCQCILK